jgi:hypothetical protein
MTDWPTFVVGETYTSAEIEAYTWCPAGSRHVPPETLFRCHEDDHGHRYFEEIVEQSPHALVPAESAQAAVEAMLREGLGMQDIATAAGVSLGAAQRAAAGHGFVRRATAAALEAAAAGNAKPSSALRQR